MSESIKGQVIASAAEVYEQFFVPALFQQWPPRVAGAAQIRAGQRVLDVACGTGILAREVSERVDPTGPVVGLDINDGMLAVARRKAPEIELRQAPAEALPFPTASFDAVVSQFSLMFFRAADQINDEQYELLLAEARSELQPFANARGEVSFSAPAHIVTATRD